jgi:hypothetical protein
VRQGADACVRPRHASFVFRSAELERDRIRLRYVLAGGPDPDISFEELLVLPETLPRAAPDDPVVVALLDGIHRVFGVSYFKAAVPATIVAEPVCEADARFWDLLYTEGLGEFYYRNQLAPIATPAFSRHARAVQPCPGEQVQRERVLTLVGGGKDSMVAREIVRHAGVDSEAFALGQAAWITRSAAAMHTQLLRVTRVLDPKLPQLNAAGAWNGHVPISACIAFVAELAAYLGGYSAVIVGNERSADEGNAVWNGLHINHQWSKSLAFEQGFVAWCSRQFAHGPVYFSLLRPLSEVRIAQEFAGYPQYFESFASCNANFRLSPTQPAERWCGACPKCVFVQLIFAPLLDDAALSSMFGRNFIEDEANLSVLEELTGLAGIKPFECVGTPQESVASLACLAAQGRLGQRLAGWYAQHWGERTEALIEQWHELLAPGTSPCVPAVWQRRLHAYLEHHRP